MKTHYEVLGVAPRADRETIRRAYLDLARRHHPDAGGDAGLMRLVNEAWKVLADPRRRRSYDITIGVLSPADLGEVADLDAGAFADHDFAAAWLAAREPSGPVRSSFLDTISLFVILVLGAFTAMSLLFGMMLTIGELLGLGVFLAFLTGVSILARMLLAMRTGVRP
jgi:hypothetical protein